jgi:hypothetical protein
MSLSSEQERIASDFPEVSWSIANQVAIFRPEGTLTIELAVRLVAWLRRIETDSAQPFSRFTDLTKVEKIEVSRVDLANVAFLRRWEYSGPPVKSAFLAHTGEGLELAEAYESFMQESNISVSVFRTLEEAAAWLGVSPGTIGPV